MKKNELKEIKGKKVEDLKALIVTKKKEMDKTYVKAMNSDEKNRKVFKNMRLAIAQLMTIVREKELANNK